jgi:riboflavin biosynthesis pyrimidine reductase
VIERELERIYGGGDFSGPGGVLHAVAVCRDNGGGLSVLRTEAAGVPTSADDRLVLGVARARADAIVTTAANLRAEPRLSHRLHRDNLTCRALSEWQGRRSCQVLVLTASGDLPLDHQVLAETPAPVIVTGSAGAELLRQRGFDSSRIEVREQPSLRDTIALAQKSYGADTVLVEAGPSTARELYTHPILSDELMLSICIRLVVLSVVSKSTRRLRVDRTHDQHDGDQNAPGAGDEGPNRRAFEPP